MHHIRVEGSDQTGYYVVIHVREPMEEMYERLEHAARFADRSKAFRLQTKVHDALCKVPLTGSKLSALNLDNWIWSPSPGTPYACLQSPPTAHCYKVA